MAYLLKFFKSNKYISKKIKNKFKINVNKQKLYVKIKFMQFKN